MWARCAAAMPYCELVSRSAYMPHMSVNRYARVSTRYAGTKRVTARNAAKGRKPMLRGRIQSLRSSPCSAKERALVSR